MRSSASNNTIIKLRTGKYAGGYASVPSDGGRNIGKVKCKNGQVETVDGCMEEA